MASQRNVQARITNLNSQLRGTKFTPPPQPRSYTAIPWNSLTIEIEQAVEDAASSELVVDANAVSAAIQLVTGSIPKFKVQRYEGWCTATALSYPTLKAEFYDVVDQDPATGVKEPRSQQSDRGTLNMPAKVGFLPPMSDQKRVLSGSTQELCRFSTGGALTGMTLLSRVHVLWVYTNATF
jgi:hypothetical protein